MYKKAPVATPRRWRPSLPSVLALCLMAIVSLVIVPWGWPSWLRRGGLRHDRGMYDEQLSWEPRAYSVHNFLSPEECAYLIRKAEPRLKRSKTRDAVSGKSSDDEERTSFNTYLKSSDDKKVAEIMERVARYTRLPTSHMEVMQILRYQASQEYKEHTDSLPSEFVPPPPASRRQATMLLYLSDVTEGGETAFPDGKWIEGGGPPNGVRGSACAEGIWVHPKAGDALFFYSLNPLGELDFASNHRGCPVIKGEKWTATIWIHHRPVDGSGRTLLEPPPPPATSCYDDQLRCPRLARYGWCESRKDEMFGTTQLRGLCMRSCGRCNDDDGSYKVPLSTMTAE